MTKKTKSIPVNPMIEEFGSGIIIGKESVKNLSTLKEEDLRSLDKAEQSHRDDYHLFFFPEKGTITVEIDFQKYQIKQSSVIYIQPNQVHRIVETENVTLSFLVISSENLNPKYLKLLGDIAPAKPLSLKEETFSIISETVSLCIKFSKRKQENLYNSLLRDSCNLLVALITSQYLAQSKSTDKFSRFRIITKDFKAVLEHNFATTKKTTEYAKKLNISTTYLNECVKNTTGDTVSYHIQQRIILEAKRLLYHSNKSVKEIASELNYHDYTYFSRLFTKVTGMTPLTFRNKYLD